MLIPRVVRFVGKDGHQSEYYVDTWETSTDLNNARISTSDASIRGTKRRAEELVRNPNFSYAHRFSHVEVCEVTISLTTNG